MDTISIINEQEIIDESMELTMAKINMFFRKSKMTKAKTDEWIKKIEDAIAKDEKTLKDYKDHPEKLDKDVKKSITIGATIFAVSTFMTAFIPGMVAVNKFLKLVQGANKVNLMVAGLATSTGIGIIKGGIFGGLYAIILNIAKNGLKEITISDYERVIKNSKEVVAWLKEQRKEMPDSIKESSEFETISIL